MGYYVGIDIGSTCAKTIVMDEDRTILHRLLQPTGWSSVDTAAAIREQLETLGVQSTTVVATGYGRVSVPYADKCVTEITCHARGACFIHGSESLTVIDIGGQDTKLISVEGGQVQDFVMNDKCSAGTGRFLEVMANTLAVRPEELCGLAEQGGNTSISSMCTVFAESEVISLIGRGEKKENIAYAVVDSIVKKVASQAGRLSLGTNVCLTGGLCEFAYLRERLSKELGVSVAASEDGRYAGAIGAALSAASLRK
jgi:predicted CoA-substrate-specific enzyme activase